MCSRVVTRPDWHGHPHARHVRGGLGGGGPQSPLPPCFQQPGNMGWGQRSELDEAQTCRVQGSLGTPPFSQMEGLKPREVPVEQAWTTPAAGSAGPAARRPPQVHHLRAMKLSHPKSTIL